MTCPSPNQSKNQACQKSTLNLNSLGPSSRDQTAVVRIRDLINDSIYTPPIKAFDGAKKANRGINFLKGLSFKRCSTSYAQQKAKQAVARSVQSRDEGRMNPQQRQPMMNFSICKSEHEQIEFRTILDKRSMISVKDHLGFAQSYIPSHSNSPFVVKTPTNVKGVDIRRSADSRNQQKLPREQITIQPSLRANRILKMDDIYGIKVIPDDFNRRIPNIKRIRFNWRQSLVS